MNGKTHSRPHPKVPGERMRVVAGRQPRRAGQPLRRELRPRAALIDWRGGGRLPPCMTHRRLDPTGEPLVSLCRGIRLRASRDHRSTPNPWTTGRSGVRFGLRRHVVIEGLERLEQLRSCSLGEQPHMSRLCGVKIVCSGRGRPRVYCSDRTPAGCSGTQRYAACVPRTATGSSRSGERLTLLGWR